MVTAVIKQGHLESRLAITTEQYTMFRVSNDELQKRLYNLCKDFHIVHRIEKCDKGFVSVAEGPSGEVTISEDEMSEFNQAHLNFIEEAEKIYENWKDFAFFNAIESLTVRPADAEKEQDSNNISMLKDILENMKTNEMFAVVCLPIHGDHIITVERIDSGLFKKLLEYYVKGH